MTDPALTAGRCQCAACGLLFSSERAFDRHRIGAYADPGQWRGKRHCMTAAELDARGWPINGRGFRMEPQRERAPAGIAGLRVTLPATGVAA